MSELNFEKQLKRMERDGVITRAQFLQLMAVAGAFVMLGTDKAYAAKSNARGRIARIHPYCRRSLRRRRCLETAG